jgi:cell fate (sporulation/competence/biofilm development) regulator YlbF (YheA/YmcA/DUF963 family)
MPTSLSSTAVLGSAALLVAGIGYMSLHSNRQQQASGGAAAITDIDDDLLEEGDYITEDEVCKIFDRLFLEMQGALAQLMQQIQQLQMQGQMIPERQLKGILKNELERTLTIKQKVILDHFDIDYDCLEEATWEFLEKDESPNNKVRKAVERFQKLWENATGEDVVGWRPGKDMSQKSAGADVLSPERTVEVAEIYFEALTDNMRQLVNRYKAEGKNVNEPAVAQQLNMDFARTANDAGEASLAGEDVTLSQFESSVKAHSQNQAVARALAMLQHKQQRDLMALGQSS